MSVGDEKMSNDGAIVSDLDTYTSIVKFEQFWFWLLPHWPLLSRIYAYGKEKRKKAQNIILIEAKDYKEICYFWEIIVIILRVT